MKKILLFLLLLLPVIGHAQLSTLVSGARTYINTNITTNGVGAITGAKANAAFIGTLNAVAYIDTAVRFGAGANLATLQRLIDSCAALRAVMGSGDTSGLGLATRYYVGQQLGALNATNLLSGTIPAARYGAGTIDVSKINASGGSSTDFLRKDGTWATPAGGGAPSFETLSGTTWALGTQPLVVQSISDTTAYTVSGGTAGAANGVFVITNTGTYPITINGDPYSIRSNGKTAISAIRLPDASYYISSDYCACSGGAEPEPDTPDAPTLGMVDDDADEFDWTNTSGFTDPGDYEYRIGGSGPYTTVTTKPLVVGDIDIPVGDLEVRVKAAGINPASASLLNEDPFTVAGGGGLVVIPFVFPTPITPSGGIVTPGAAGYSTSTESDKILPSGTSGYLQFDVASANCVLGFKATGGLYGDRTDYIAGMYIVGGTLHYVDAGAPTTGTTIPVGTTKCRLYYDHVADEFTTEFFDGTTWTVANTLTVTLGTPANMSIYLTDNSGHLDNPVGFGIE